MKRLPRRMRERLKHMVGAGEPPDRLAASWALGFAVAFSPFIGLHWVMAVIAAHLMRLNKLDAVLGTLVINPWTLTVYFPGAVLLGHMVTGVGVPRIVLPHLGEVLKKDYWLQQGEWLRPLLLTWTVGATICAVVVGFGTFVLLRRLIERHRQHLEDGRPSE